MQVDLAHPQDYELEEPTQENQDQEHEVQMEQEVRLGSEQQALEHAEPEYQQGRNQNSTTKVEMIASSLVAIASDDAITNKVG